MVEERSHPAASPPTPTCSTARRAPASARPRERWPPSCWPPASPNEASARARARSGAHPDLTWVKPSGAHEMLVADIDGPVIGAASRTPFESARRVFVIERADTLNDEGANRMLKTLEEPAPFVHLILLTDRLVEVLPTIVSRCQLVRFEAPRWWRSPPGVEATGVAADTAAACARLALGDAGNARGSSRRPEGGAVLRGRALWNRVRRSLAVSKGRRGHRPDCSDAVKARGEAGARGDRGARSARRLRAVLRVRNEAGPRTEVRAQVKRRRRRVETACTGSRARPRRAWLPRSRLRWPGTRPTWYTTAIV